MKHRIRALALATPLLLLGACGGGSDSGIFLFNFFVGLWVNTCEPNGTGTGSETVNMRLVQGGDGNVSGGFSVSSYSNTICSGTPTSVVQFTLQQNGTQVVGSDTAIQVAIAGNGTSQNDLLLVKDGLLFRSSAGAAGPNGYPLTIDFSSPYSRP
jgi:hypothetical protein